MKNTRFLLSLLLLSLAPRVFGAANNPALLWHDYVTRAEMERLFPEWKLKVGPDQLRLDSACILQDLETEKLNGRVGSLEKVYRDESGRQRAIVVLWSDTNEGLWHSSFAFPTKNIYRMPRNQDLETLTEDKCHQIAAMFISLAEPNPFYNPPGIQNQFILPNEEGPLRALLAFVIHKYGSIGFQQVMDSIWQKDQSYMYSVNLIGINMINSL